MCMHECIYVPYHICAVAIAVQRGHWMPLEVHIWVVVSCLVSN